MENPRSRAWRQLVRRLFGILVAAALFVGVAAASADTTEASVIVAVAQDAEEGPDRVLKLGEAYSGPGYELIAQASFSEVIPNRPGYSQILVGVILKNTSPAQYVYNDLGFPTLPGRPELIVRAGNGVYPIDLLHPVVGARPGSDVTAINPGMTVRWTYGYQVPTSALGDPELELVSDEGLLATWDLNAPPVEVGFAPVDADLIAIGDQISWDEKVRVSATSYGSLVCGDPTIEPVAHIIAVVFEVTNTNETEYLWPGVSTPRTPAIAQWSDGGAARFVLDTYVGDQEVLHKPDAATTVFPPSTTLERALLMAAPRDGRFVDLARMPLGVWLYPPNEEARFLVLSEVAPSLGIDPAFCDLGFLGAPIPYAFGPSPRFVFGGEGPFPNPIELNDQAQLLLTNALAAAGMYFEANGFTFAGVTTSDLTQYGPNITWQETAAGSSIATAIGEVYWDAVDSDVFFVMTESAAGAWFCANTIANLATNYGTGLTSVEAGELCIAAAFGGEVEAELETEVR
jgi:hypothetical protein